MTDISEGGSVKEEEAESTAPAPDLAEAVTAVEKEVPIAEQLGAVTDSVAFSIIDDLLQFNKVKFMTSCQQ